MRCLLHAALLGAAAMAADPTCSTGIPSKSPPSVGDACCKKECGRCGGTGCGGFPGGAASCCTGTIVSAGKSCYTSDPPCVVTDPPHPSGSSVSVTVGAARATVAEEYVSFTIDTSTWPRVDFSNTTLGLVAKALSPAHLRVGGTQEDYEIYALGADVNASCSNLPSPMTDYRCHVVNETLWTTLLDFCGDNNLTLVFGLNDMYGRPTKTKPEKQLCSHSSCPPHNQSNLKELLKWTAANRPGAPIYAFELGNELNSVLNGSVGAKAQAEDFIALSKVVESVWPSGRRPKLVGPDPLSGALFEKSVQGQTWWGNFSAAAGSVVSSHTFHMYIFGNAKYIDPDRLGEWFLSPTRLDKSYTGGVIATGIVGKTAPGTDVWAGETAAAYDGGLSGVTDTYVDGFWYLDQLGSLAAAGVTVFLRQTIIAGGGYPLVEMAKDGTLTVLPDYWVALLYSRLMGTKVLTVTSSSSYLRAYAHCSRKGGVAYAILNIDTKAVNVTFPSELGTERADWLLQPGEKLPKAPNPLQSKEMKLNGVKLDIGHGPTLPNLDGKPATGSVMEIPATAYAFVQFPGAKLAACQ